MDNRAREVPDPGAVQEENSGFGCRTSWRQGTSGCPNRLAIRAKVAEPQILRKLQAELLEPTTLAYITEQVKATLATQPAEGDAGEVLRKQLADGKVGRWRERNARRRNASP